MEARLAHLALCGQHRCATVMQHRQTFEDDLPPDPAKYVRRPEAPLRDQQRGIEHLRPLLRVLPRVMPVLLKRLRNVRKAMSDRQPQPEIPIIRPSKHRIETSDVCERRPADEDS
jgi:hypothetical protein